MFAWLEQGLEFADSALVHATSGASPAFSLMTAALLGLRHASDPDHIASVAEIMADRRGQSASAAMMGAAWGSGHAAMLLICGLAMMTMNWAIPSAVHHGSEILVGVVILALAMRLMWQWLRPVDRNSSFLLGGKRGAFTVGGLHGFAGSGAVMLLLLAAMPDRNLAALALLIFALGATISMTLCAIGMRSLMRIEAIRRRFRGIAIPVFCALNAAFGLWYIGRI